MKHPCVFRTEFHKEQVNARLVGGLKNKRKVPFGDFTRTWRQEHCARINPYGSESCPYRPEDCSMAFLNVAQRAMEMDEPGAYFRVHAKYTGLDRAENKPLARERYDRTDGHPSGAPGLRDGPGARPGDVLGGPLESNAEVRDRVPPARRVSDDGSLGVHRTTGGLQPMGALLRGDDPGPRTRAYGRHEGEETTDHDGDGRDPVPPPPPERLGDQPSSGDPELHQGGE